jgi:spore coat protein CotH
MRLRLSVTALLGVLAAGLVVRGQIRQPLLGINATDAFFDDSVVQDIRLDLNAGDWQTLRANFREDTYYPADFRWKDQVVRNVGIRSRGFGTRNPVKPSLRVDFNRFSPDQEFLEVKSVVLKNNVSDPSNMHERISMLLLRRLGLFASRETHARLFVNGEYYGVYTLAEAVDKHFLKRVFGENDGYLFGYTWAFRYFFGDLGTDPAAYVPIPFEPETHEDDPEPLAIVDLVQAINRSPNFAGEINTYIDIRKFVRQIAVETFLADRDDFLGEYGMANFFLYRPPGRRQFTMIAWDKSEAFSTPFFEIFQRVFENQLASRALDVPELRSLYFDTLLECVTSINEPGSTDPRGWLDREIDRENAQIRDAVLADPVKPFANGDYDAAVAGLHDFARQRGPFVVQAVGAQR